MTRGAPGTTITRVFHRRPKVAMHHQRNPCEAATRVSMAHARTATTSGRRIHTSVSAPTSSPVCSITIGG